MKNLKYILLSTFIIFLLPTFTKAEDNNNNLILYRTENYNIPDNCTFTGLTGLYELQYCDNEVENVPNNTDHCWSWVHTYMPYTAVTSENSIQYQVLNSDYAWSDEDTGLRMYKDRICVAIGTGYEAEAGDYIDLVLEDNTIVKCIVGDIKSDLHTDDTNKFHTVDGSVVECIIDYTYFNDTSQYPDFFKDLKVIKIVNVDELYDDSFHNERPIT